jgi:hypothetical protein
VTVTPATASWGAYEGDVKENRDLIVSKKSHTPPPPLQKWYFLPGDFSLFSPPCAFYSVLFPFIFFQAFTVPFYFYFYFNSFFTFARFYIFLKMFLARIVSGWYSTLQKKGTC